MIPHPWVALILTMAVYRLFRLAAWDTFPPVVRARGWAVGAYQITTGSTNTLLGLNGEEPEVEVRFRRPTLEHFIHCPYCLGFWLSLATYGAWVWQPHDSLYFFAPFALNGVMALVAEHFDPGMTAAELTEGVVERHYLRCPHCHGYMNLDTRRCSTCGARPVAILWTDPARPTSPELVMVDRPR